MPQCPKPEVRLLGKLNGEQWRTILFHSDPLRPYFADKIPPVWLVPFLPDTSALFLLPCMSVRLERLMHVAVLVAEQMWNWFLRAKVVQ